MARIAGIDLPKQKKTYIGLTYIYGIGQHTSLDILKKAKVDASIQINREETENKGAFQIPAPSLTPEEQLINDQKIGLMRHVVKRLKPQYRRLIELRYFKEYSYAEIVDEVEMPLGTIKAQIFRARELMFQMLKTQKEVI